MNNSSNSFDRYANLKRNFAPYHKTESAGQIVNHDEGHKNLSDYIRSINRAQAFDDVAAEKKLTFDEWYQKNKNKIGYDYEASQFIWKAALENK